MWGPVESLQVSVLAALPSVVAICALLLAALKLKRRVVVLDKDDYLLVSRYSGKDVVRGPGLRMPLFASFERCKAVTLSGVQYAIVKDEITGEKRVVKGPTLLFLGPYDTIEEKADAKTLGPTEYLVVEDTLSSKKRLERGPQVFFPGAYDRFTRTREATALQHNTFLRIKDQETGAVWMESGPKLVFLEPTHVLVGDMSEAWSLKENEYVKLLDSSTGKVRLVRGEKMVFPGVNESLQGGVSTAWSLKADEYVKLHDASTGKVRVVRGEQMVFPEVNESMVGGGILTATRLEPWEYSRVIDTAAGTTRIVKGPTLLFLGASEIYAVKSMKEQAVEVDQETAVLVRDKSTGRQRLVTEPQLFMPTVDEEILQVRKLIKLADHECMICTDEKGDFRYFYGSADKRQSANSEEQRSFFLPPYWEQHTLLWSRGRRRERRDLKITRFDIRPQYMSFEFSCRTADNVELVLEGTFFWEVFDLPAMMSMTGDAPGDICNHARSQFIQLVSKVKLQDFMNDFNGIAARAHNDHQQFYEMRGIKIHSLEVTKYSCADVSTAAILEQIIQETTNRMNRLSQQESENEVNLFKVKGLIEKENLNAELLKIQHEHAKNTALNAGTAEGEMVRAFLTGLESTVPDLQSRIDLWNVLRKGDALTTISKGSAHVYFTPKDVNLSIESPAPAE